MVDRIPVVWDAGGEPWLVFFGGGRGWRCQLRPLGLEGQELEDFAWRRGRCPRFRFGLE